MDDDPMIATCAARSALCREHGDDYSADYWWEFAERLSDQQEQRRRRSEYDILKGSPDHSHSDG